MIASFEGDIKYVCNKNTHPIKCQKVSHCHIIRVMDIYTYSNMTNM